MEFCDLGSCTAGQAYHKCAIHFPHCQILSVSLPDTQKLSLTLLMRSCCLMCCRRLNPGQYVRDPTANRLSGACLSRSSRLVFNFQRRLYLPATPSSALGHSTLKNSDRHSSDARVRSTFLASLGSSVGEAPEGHFPCDDRNGKFQKEGSRNQIISASASSRKLPPP